MQRQEYLPAYHQAGLPAAGRQAKDVDHYGVVGFKDMTILVVSAVVTRGLESLV